MLIIMINDAGPAVVIKSKTFYIMAKCSLNLELAAMSAVYVSLPMLGLLDQSTLVTFTV